MGESGKAYWIVMHEQGRIQRLSTPLICGFGLFLAGYVFYSSALIERFFSQELQLSSWQIGMAQATIPLGAMLGALIVGCFADQWGRSRTLAYCFLMLSIVSAISLFVIDLYSLSMIRFLHGFFAGSLYPLCATYLSETAAQHKLAKLTALLMFINCLAAPVACILLKCFSMLSADFYLWRIMMSWQAIPCLLAYVYACKLTESLAWQQMQMVKPMTPPTFAFAWQSMFNQKYRSLSVCLMTSWFLMDVAYYGINFFITYLLSITENTLSSSKHMLHLYTFIIDVFFLLGAFAAIFVVNQYNLIQLQKNGFLIAAISLLLLAIYIFSTSSTNIFVIVSLFIMFNLALNIGPDVTTYLLSATSYPVMMRGAAHGLITSVAKLGSFLGVLFLPHVTELWGCESVLFIIAMLLFLAFYITSNLAILILKPNSIEAEPIYETN